MEGYSVKIRESSKELSAKERIALKDYSNAIALDTALNEVDVLTISPVGYVILDVHNEKSKQDKDYVKYVLIDAGGNKYVTGSESFFTSFIDIFRTMAEEAPGEEYSIDVLKKPSQNYKGKNFLTCALAL